jgi:hypothetical protein
MRDGGNRKIEGTVLYWGKRLKEDIYKNVPPPSAFKVLECSLAFSPESNQRGNRVCWVWGGGGTGKYSLLYYSKVREGYYKKIIE